jgi:hypothetical protein
MFSKAITLDFGQLPNAIADLYQPPAGQSAYVKKIRLANPTGGTVTMTLSKRVSGTDYLMCNLSLATGEWAEWTDLVLGDGEILRGFASAAASIDFLVEGVLES